MGIAECHGGKIAREAKALAPSASVWTRGAKVRAIWYDEILDRAVRSADPFVRVKGRWIVRRLAPDCSRVELASMPKARDESRLLQSMGFETANVHLGKRKVATSILNDLRKRPRLRLHRAALDMAEATTRDWERWRAHCSRGKKGVPASAGA